MKLLQKVDITSLILAGLIIYILFFNREPKDNSKVYTDYIKEMHLNELKRIKNDSIRYTSKIDSLTLKIRNLNYLRKDERNKYLQEQSKYNNLVNDSSYFAVIDSIKKLCCPNSPSR